MIYTAEIEPIARQAGAMLMTYFRQRIGFEYKGDVDLVTEADRASERFITAELQRRWPDFGILGEEGTRSDMDAEYRWLVDPLDGTTNFAHGYPVFCVAIALVRGEQIEAGFLYDPTRDEFFSAECGHGAKLNGQSIRVSRTRTLSESILGTGFPSHKRHKNPNVHFYHQLTLRSHGLRRAGSAALDLANVACGRYDGFWEFNLNPWDTAAGSVLVEEAGGKITRLDGSPWLLDSKETLATNRIVHQDFIDVIQQIFEGRDMPELPNPAEYARQRP